MRRRKHSQEAPAVVEERPWKGKRVPHDLNALPPRLLEDMKQWADLTPPMPDVTTIRMCGCHDEPWARIVLCSRHEGFLEALEAGYNDGYFEALNTVDNVERKKITEQKAIRPDGLSLPVKAPLWAVLYAIRYGMTRYTYACSDAARLAFEFWDQFPDHIKDQIRNDVKHVDSVCADEWAWLYHR
jgi:hypothetical protein